MSARREHAETDRLLEAVLAGRAEGTTAALIRDGLALEVPAATRARHLAALTREAPAATVTRPASRPFRVRATVAGLAAASILVLGSSSAIAASSGAVPGDSLYGLKRAVERVGLAMHRDPGSRAEFHLRLAGRRLAEAEALVAGGHGAGGAYRGYERALAAAEANALEAAGLGHDVEALLDHIRAAISKHVDRLSALLAQVPEQAQDAIQRAIDRAAEARDRVLQGRLQHGPPETPGRGKPTEAPGNSGQAPGRR